jgi:hypothetical protein
MQSIDDLAREITSLPRAAQEALIEKVGQLNLQKGVDDLTGPKIAAMQQAMSDELFLADLREVMEDFRDVDAEEVLA